MSAELIVLTISAITATVALLVAVLTFIMTRGYFNHDRIHRLTDRLYQLDDILMHSPSLQKFLYEQTERAEPYYTEATPHDDQYFMVKSFVYRQLNLFDEMFCTVAGNKSLEKAIEFDDWKNYIVRKMRHPLFRELYQKESSIWGAKFRNFCKANWESISEAPQKDMW